jgi:hypothetical protein
MRVLFDQATPVPIREFLIGHTVRTAAQEHWDTPLRSDTRLNRSLSTDRSCLVVSVHWSLAFIGGDSAREAGLVLRCGCRVTFDNET